MTVNKKKGVNGRVKGRQFELKIAKILSDTFKIKWLADIHRTPNSGGLHSKVDVWLSPKYRSIFPFFLELKKHETVQLEKSCFSTWKPFIWFQEAKDKVPNDQDYDPDSPVMLVFSKNNTEIFSMIETDYFNNNFNKNDFSFVLTIKNPSVTILLFKEVLSVLSK